MVAKKLIRPYQNLPSWYGYIFLSLPLLALDHLADMSYSEACAFSCQVSNPVLAVGETTKGYFSMFSLASFESLPHKGAIH